MVESGAPEVEIVRIVGQVCRRRSQSCFVLFLDVALQGPEGGVCAVTLRADTLRKGQPELQRIRHEVKCGDEVVVHGHPEESRPPTTGGCTTGLRCVTLEVLRPWLFISSQPYQRPRPPPAGAVPAPDNAGADLCKAWIATGHCTRPGCKFRHMPGAGQTVGAARYEWVQQRRRQRQGQPTIAGEEDVDSALKRPRRQRAVVFCDWLVATFPPHILSRGVIDVAGGRGEVAFELAVIRQLPTLVVDPRPVRLSRWQCRHILANGIAPAHRPLDNFPPTGQPDTPAHRRTPPHGSSEVTAEKQPARPCSHDRHAPPMNARAIPEEDEFCHSEDETEEDGDETIASAEPSEGRLTARHFIHQVQMTFEDFLEARSEVARRAPPEGQLLVGMHPDEATEPLVDFAIRTGMPFAVVPCCVFSYTNPSRRVDGKAVTSYPDFVRYLRSKHPAIQQASLQFHGRNIVLYCSDWTSCLNGVAARTETEEH